MTSVYALVKCFHEFHSEHPLVTIDVSGDLIQDPEAELTRLMTQQ